MNAKEREIADALEARGLVVMNNGWPDFLVRRDDGAIALVEVKSNDDVVRDNQTQVHSAFATLGLVTAIVRRPEDLGGVRFVLAPHTGSLVQQVVDLTERLQVAEARVKELEKVRFDADEWEKKEQAKRLDGPGRFAAEVLDLINRTIGEDTGREMRYQIQEAFARSSNIREAMRESARLEAVGKLAAYHVVNHT